MAEQRPLLEINQLRFRWPSGQRDVLDIPALSIARSERVFIKGQSGAGKTTLLGLIGGINVPQAGSIHLLDQNTTAFSQSRRDQFRADHIGFIFQLFNLIPYLSVVENVTLACRFSRIRRERALANSATLEQEALRLLAHLNMADADLVAKPVEALSVGQQQRVATARALIGAPELLIADEPTSALDADTREQFLQLLLSECEQAGTTVLFVSHDSALEAQFERSIALHSINRAAQAPAGENSA